MASFPPPPGPGGPPRDGHDPVGQYMASPEGQAAAIQGAFRAQTAMTEQQQRPGGLSATAGAAAAGLAVGAVAVGGLVAPVGLALGAAAATTQDGQVGDAARHVGQATTDGLRAAKRFDDEHNVSGTIKDGCAAAVAKARALDAQYDIAGTTKAGAAAAVAKTKELNARFGVTDKLGSAAASGWGALQRAVKPPPDGGGAAPPVAIARPVGPPGK